MADVQPAELPAATAVAPSSVSPQPDSPAPPSTSSTAPPSPSSPSALPPFSSALYDVLSPALSCCDSAISSVFASQDALAAQIDSLSLVLSSFHSLHQSAAFAPYTAKLQGAKKRIRRLQSSVERINERLDDLRDLIRRKEGIDGYSAQSSPTLDLQAGLTSLTRLTEKGPHSSPPYLCVHSLSPHARRCAHSPLYSPCSRFLVCQHDTAEGAGAASSEGRCSGRRRSAGSSGRFRPHVQRPCVGSRRLGSCACADSHHCWQQCAAARSAGVG